MRDVVVVGGGRFGLEVVTYLHDLAKSGAAPAVRGVIDDSSPDLSDFPGGVRQIGSLSDWDPEGFDHIIAIGDSAVRWKVAALLRDRSARFLSMIHPTAYVADTAEIGPGAVICPLAFVGPYARMGAHGVINVQASLGHDARLGTAAVLSPGAKVSGRGEIGEGAFLGTLAVMTPGSKLGAFSKLAAGSVWFGNAPDGALVVGNPGKSRVMFRVPEGVSVSPTRERRIDSEEPLSQ